MFNIKMKLSFIYEKNFIYIDQDKANYLFCEFCFFIQMLLEFKHFSYKLSYIQTYHFFQF